MQNLEFYHHKLANIFRLISDYEYKIEKLRTDLAKLKQFEPFQAFNYLDKSQYGNILPNDLQLFMEQNHNFVSKEDINHLINLAQTKDGQMSYDAFKICILPQNDQFLHKKCFKKRIQTSKINKIVKRKIFEILDQEIMFFHELQQCVLLLGNHFQNNLRDSFELIDRTGCGCITLKNLKRFMQVFYVNLTELQFNAIQRRFSLNQNGKINYDDFKRFMRNYYERRESCRYIGSFRVNQENRVNRMLYWPQQEQKLAFNNTFRQVQRDAFKTRRKILNLSGQKEQYTSKRLQNAKDTVRNNWNNFKIQAQIERNSYFNKS